MARAQMLTAADAQLRPMGYAVEKCLGSGTYGAVFAARRLRDGAAVAVKMFRTFGEDRTRFPHLCKGGGLDCSTTREIVIAADVSHASCYVVPLVDFVVEGPQPFAFFRLLEQDLTHAYRHLFRTLHPLLLKLIAFQIFHGIADMHAMRYLHRDIKPQNILLDFRDGAWEESRARGLLPAAPTAPGGGRVPRVVLGDMGLARSFADIDSPDARQKTNEVVTLWYRAPEVVLGSVVYGPAIDMWSAGCVLAELARCLPDGCPPPFREARSSALTRSLRNEHYERVRLWACGEDYGQLIRVFAHLGTPTKTTWPGAAALPKWPGYHAWPSFPSRRIECLCPSLDPQGCDLLSRLLVLDPRGRLSAAAALAHPFFDEVRACFPPTPYLQPVAFLPRRLRTERPERPERTERGGGDTTEPEDEDGDGSVSFSDVRVVTGSTGSTGGGSATSASSSSSSSSAAAAVAAASAAAMAAVAPLMRCPPPFAAMDHDGREGGDESDDTSPEAFDTAPTHYTARPAPATLRTTAHPRRLAAGVTRPRETAQERSSAERQPQRPRID